MPGSNLPEYRHARSGSLNIPNGAAAPSAPRFDGPRSPPNTSHVPCKFFRQGACQAGNACPFSHDLSTAAENICKYFAKGNCKFGPKCANIHVLPDGRRINYGKHGVTIGPAPLAGSPARPTTATQNNFHPSTSAITNGLYRADNIPPYTPTYASFQSGTDEMHHHLGRQPSLENGLPTIDTPGYSGSAFGSPRDDDASRFGLALSPVNAKGLSVLDAPLPASFDSNGISNAARYPAGPWPSSVPSKFGLESPSPSLNAAKDARTSEALKLLHTSAFGSNEHLSPNIPPSSSPSAGLTDEPFGKRTMHSSRYTKPRVLSSSLPKAATVDRDWEAEFAFLEEDYVPQNLQDLLTPAEKARRGSLRAVDAERPEGITKYGSPIGAASPSRWGPLFQRQKEEEFEGSRSLKASAFGHVGSPLRNSSLADEVDARQNGNRLSGSRSGGDGMSALTQQLQRTRMNDDPVNPMLHPNSAAGRSTSSMVPRERDRTFERHVSTGSIGSALGRMTTPIDEEESAFLFRMEEEDEQQPSRSRRNQPSIGWSLAGSSKVDSKDHREPSEPVGGR
ncbi:hypothetical protein jhhlp_001639 [Lomentospora prolificans]|uniref:C3H1-type domain-containing protein n=1 Tax=Lomentospora prolificans TaxID=41688 RepID=A0A2N3NIQ9_9PEZI|nr:hypothetical protein jhhlp_001639 [Lomentospora prolificans]